MRTAKGNRLAARLTSTRRSRRRARPKKAVRTVCSGVDVESTPLVALAALASIALALAAWLRPGWIALLTLIAVAMIAFAVLDVREVFHQLNEDKGGLAALAGLAAVVHLAAGGLGAAQRQRVRA